MTCSSASVGPLTLISTFPAELDRTTAKWLLVPATRKSSAGPPDVKRDFEVQQAATLRHAFSSRSCDRRSLARVRRGLRIRAGACARAQAGKAPPTIGDTARRTNSPWPLPGWRPREPRPDQGRQQVRPILADAPAQEQVSGPAVAVAAEQVGRVVILHDQLVRSGCDRKALTR